MKFSYSDTTVLYLQVRKLCDLQGGVSMSFLHLFFQDLEGAFGVECQSIGKQLHSILFFLFYSLINEDIVDIGLDN